ncbi:MAG: type IV pilus twitching motility protein PilT [Acetivibrionales bacterium]
MFDFIKEVLQYAKTNNATDLHLAAGSVPRTRIDGQLLPTPFDKVMSETTTRIIDSILNDDQKETLKERHYISIPFPIEDIGRVRANVFMQRGSYSINFKLLDKPLPSYEELGIPDVVINLSELKNGLVLVCGDRKTGKSTTVASIIKKISESRKCHIITVEDPIEYLYRHDESIISQKEVGLDILSFSDGIYSAVAQDPDVIMISFAGDPETFSAALYAAENGHLVLTSLKASSSVKAIEYITGMYPGDRRNHIKMQLSSVLQAIVVQKLIPAIDGKGMKLATEVMLANSAMRNLILENKAHQIPAVIKASKALGMMTMEDSINELYARGWISKENAHSYIADV